MNATGFSSSFRYVQSTDNVDEIASERVTDTMSVRHATSTHYEDS